jgi:transposase
MNQAVTEKFAGIDVSKDTLDVSIDTDEKSLHVSYDEVGLKQIEACLQEAGPNLIVLEATGGLESHVMTELARRGWRWSIRVR